MNKLIYWNLCLAIWLGIASQGCAQNKTTLKLADDEKLIEFTTDRFTLPNLYVTPDGKNIIFDVLGDIYQVPIKGGKAEVLLQDNNWKRAGKLSPDGKKLAYVSDETGVFQVWTIDLESKIKRVYPITESRHLPMYAYWKDEKHLLIPSKEGLQSFDITTGKGQITRPALEEEKVVMHTVNRTMSVDKLCNYAFFQKNGDLWAYDVDKNIDLFIESIPDKVLLKSVRGSENGRNLLFYKVNPQDNTKQDLVHWNLATNNLIILNTIQTLGISTSLNYSFDFIDGTTIILDKEGEIVRMDIETGEYEPIPIELEVRKVIKKPLRRKPQYIKDSIITASVLRNPVTQPDLDTIYFGAFGKLHSYAKTTGNIKEMYPDEDRLEVSPSLSPDGKYLAYTTWNDTEMGHLYTRKIKTGEEYQLTQTPGRYINPAWSPDGSEIVFVADETEAKMGIPNQISGSNSIEYQLSIKTVGVIGNYFSNDIIEVYPKTNFPNRFYPIPIYYPNGKGLYITTRNRDKNLPVLIEIDLETKDVVKELLIPFNIDEVVVSPNANYIAFIFDEQVWVDRFPYSLKFEFAENSESTRKKYHYNGGYITNILLPAAKSVYEVAPSYLSWQDENILMWGSAEEIYTYDVRIGKTEKITDIKVQRYRDIPKAQYALTNARIITMNKEDKIIKKGTILVKDNRIEKVGDVDKIMIPKNYKVFNLEGKTIIPGLIDVHSHLHFYPSEFVNQQEAQYIGSLAYGITTVYDPSQKVLNYREQAQMLETGKLLGPRIFASGNINIGASRRMSEHYKNISSINDARRIVKSNKKIGVSGPIKDYNIEDKKIRSLLLEACKEFGINITAHQDIFTTAISRITQGYTAIEHEIGNYPMQKDIIQLISHSGFYYTPTYIVSPGVTDIFTEITSKERNKLINFNGDVMYDNKYANIYENNDPNKQIFINQWRKIGDYEQLRAIKTLGNIVDSGGKVTAGGHGDPLPGIGMHWEIWFMAEGISNYEALQIATINGAEKLDLQDEIGTIESNKLADLVILNSDPLKRIFNTTDILYTIQNGNIFEAETMRQIYPFERKLKPWGWDINR
ncbi:amidohydrolase family protein [Gelidibacter gilvus]|uniref:Amidohydrolase-related domain-containing protein n=1 Tax=Gelidibacter gilvus TaxID=59602 RepID=A0A4Q0XCG1_9FLAO|nr:amidohydrolase family protein [Gelidibacter gilvus]RXJ45387.1 hypothetical protein ESZ48_16345 [Gelidibacter gilvus]